MKEFPKIPMKKYEDLRPFISPGDILLCSGTSNVSEIIKKTTDSVWSHVGLIMKIYDISGSRVMVFESVETIGVRAVPLSNYINNYNGSGSPYPGVLMIARHSGFNDTLISKVYNTAINLLGYPYDNEEIMKILGKIALGLNSPSSYYRHRKAFICSEYVDTCFKSSGITIKDNVPSFITPDDFAECAEIKPINYTGGFSPYGYDII